MIYKFNYLHIILIIIAWITYSQATLSLGHCSTIISSDIRKLTTWKVEDSPYCLKAYKFGYIDISSNAILTIEPGVVVYFIGDTTLRVAGHLIAKGTPKHNIHFIQQNNM